VYSYVERQAMIPCESIARILLVRQIVLLRHLLRNLSLCDTNIDTVCHSVPQLLSKSVECLCTLQCL
jgi:hypothetical protein